MAEPVSGVCELEWDERLILERIDDVSFLTDLIYQRLTHGHGEKFAEHNPLIMPNTDSPSLFEEIVTGSEPGPQVVDDRVMEL
jgi:hypothetical protein